MKIFIDAGHNDSKVDTGASGNGLREQDITFAISSLLSQKLKEVGVDVKLSREKKDTIIGNDLDSSLSMRTEMANNWGAELFISIHCNSSEDPNSNGTEVYVYNSYSKAKELANMVCENICENINTYNRGVKNANFAVLRKTSMPAMLIECAFINNQEDSLKLKNNQDEIAEAIFSEIVCYYNIEIPTKDLETINDIVWEFHHRGIITDKELWLKKLEEDKNSYWLARKAINYIIDKC